MSHIHEDELLEYALETIDDGKTRLRIESHLDGCEACRDVLARIRSDMEIIGGIKPDVAVPREVAPASADTHGDFRARSSRRFVTSFARAAALILCGIAIGYGAAKWSEKEPSTVVPQYFQMTAAGDSAYAYAASDATAAGVGFGTRSN